MKDLSSILQIKQRKSPILRSVALSMLAEKTNEIIKDVVGENALKYAKVIYVKNGIITLACLNSAVAQEIKLSEAKIFQKVNEYMGKNEVFKIRYLA